MLLRLELRLSLGVGGLLLLRGRARADRRVQAEGGVLLLFGELVFAFAVLPASAATFLSTFLWSYLRFCGVL